MHVAAIENEDVLRAIAEQDMTMDDLADKFERDRSNMRRSLKRLEAAGILTTAPTLQLLEPGKLALQALDVAAGRLTVGGTADGFHDLLHCQIVPDRLNPRKDTVSADFDDDLDSLRQDVLQNGLLQNLVVRPDGVYPAIWGDPPTDANGVRLPIYRLVSGERRWRAIKEAIFDGDWPADRAIPCKVIETDDLGHQLRALAENLQRRALNPVEEARAFKALADAGMSTSDIAARVSIGQRVVQQRLQLLQLDADQLARMTLPKDDEDHLSVTEARALVQTAAEKPPAPADDGDTPEMFQPPSVTLPPDWMLLALAEIRLAYRDNWSAEISPDKVTQGTVNLLIEAGYVDIPRLANDGTLRIQTRWPVWTALASVGCPANDAENIKAAVELLRTRTGLKPAEGKTYATEWLNGPFELTDAGRVVLRKAQEDKAAREEKRRASTETAALRDQAIADFRRDWANVEQPEAFRVLLETLGIPAPWTSDRYQLKAANGHRLDSYSAHHKAAKIFAIALASGSPIPPAESDDEDEGEEE